MKQLIICLTLVTLAGCGGTAPDPFEVARKTPQSQHTNHVANPTDPFKDFISKH